jgi:hypothetical protein
MDKTLQVQLQIRQNAEEISSALKEIGKWEKTIKQKDRAVAKAPAKPRTSIAVKTSDVSTALRSGGGTVPLRSMTAATVRTEARDLNQLQEEAVSQLTPASIASMPIATLTTTQLGVVPKALGKYEERNAEEAERERGNQEFKSGNFAAAVKSYTKCLGLKVWACFCCYCC